MLFYQNLFGMSKKMIYGVSAIIYTQQISRQFQLDIAPIMPNMHLLMLKHSVYHMNASFV